MDYEWYLKMLQSNKEEFMIHANSLDAHFQETFTWIENNLSCITQCIEESKKVNSTTSNKSRKRCMNLVIKEEEEDENDESEKQATVKRQLSNESDSSEKQESELLPRTRRNASKKARAAINEQVKLKLGTKLRRPDNHTGLGSVYVKLEKTDDKENVYSSNEKESSDISNEKHNDLNNDSSKVDNRLSNKENLNMNFNYNIFAKEIKKEKTEDFLMPPPHVAKVKKVKKLVKRSSKRTNNKKVSTLSNLTDDENDIIEVTLESKKMSVVNIDSENEDDKENIQNETDKSVVSKNNQEVEEDSCNDSGEKKETEDKSAYETLEKNNVEKTICQDSEEHRNNLREETMYEDAVQENKEQNEFIIKDCSVALSKLTLPCNEENHKLDKQPSYKSALLDVTVTLEKTYLLNETYSKQMLPSPAKTNETNMKLPIASLNKDKKKSPLITDDESSSDFKTPEKCKPIKKSKLKQPLLFSPFTNDPVKKRVEAFEKLEKDNTASTTKEPVRLTRTKTRALAAAKEAKEKVNDSDCKENERNNTNLFRAEKNTPLNTNRLIPITTQFSSKPLARSTPMVKSTESLKSVSSAKLRSNEKKDELRKLKEKEDVQRKKEALLQARIEEQRKKRVEKAFKAQQTREILERERQFAILQAEREKEEKQKQLQADREEMLKKEAQRKKALAAQRAAETEERRKAEEAARLAKLQEQDEAEKRAEIQRKKDLDEAERLHQKRLAEEREAELLRAQARAKIKANIKAKLFNKVKTDTTPAANVPYSKIPVKENDMFDSGESTDDETNPKRPIPLWSKSTNRKKPVSEQFYIPSNIILKFFSCKPTVIDLTEIFDQLNSRDLRRNSSAVWRTPPRYSQIPKY